MKKLLAVLALLTFCGTTAMAGRMDDSYPLNDTFDNLPNTGVVYKTSGYTVGKNPSTAASNAQIVDHKMVINLLGGTSITVGKNLSAPLNADKINFEFDFMMKNDNLLISYSGPFMMVDDEGTQTYQRFNSMANEAKGYVNGSGRTLKNFSWKKDIQYKVKYEIDMVKKVYKFFVDSGSGYQQILDTTGNGEFTYNGKNLKQIRFGFVSGGTNTNMKYIIDNVRIYAPDWEYIYVCPTTGNDANDGSYEKPLKTVEAAYRLAESRIGMDNKEVFVKIRSGNYNFDSSYTFGELDKNAYYDKVAFLPDNYADITISGDYNVNMPGLDNLENEDLKAEFINDIKEHYVQTYDSYPLSIGNLETREDAEGNLVTTVRLANSGKTTARAALVTILYDEYGALMGIDIANDTVIPGTEKKVTSTIAIGEAAAYRCFLWEDMSTLIPLIKSEFVAEIALNNVYADRVTKLEMVTGSDNVTINGTTVPNSMVSVCMRAGTNRVVYAQQTVSDAEGDFNFDVKPTFMPVIGTISISSTDGGAN